MDRRMEPRARAPLFVPCAPRRARALARALAPLPHALRPVAAAGSRARRARLFACGGRSNTGIDGEEEREEGEDESMRSFRRGGGGGARREYNGDALPFDVRVLSPPEDVRLGRFRLDARTHCGDIISHAGRHFVVKRVRLHYRYGANGESVVFRKTIEIKSLARKAIESYLEKSLNN